MKIDKSIIFFVMAASAALSTIIYVHQNQKYEKRV